LADAKRTDNIRPIFVIDASCGAVTVQQQQSNFIMTSQISFPYFPIISEFADISGYKGLESVVLQFASPITFAGDTTKKFTPVAFSSSQSGTARTPLYFDVQRQWSENDFLCRELLWQVFLKENSPEKQSKNYTGFRRRFCGKRISERESASAG
jgi:hypothetical protein